MFCAQTTVRLSLQYKNVRRIMKHSARTDAVLSVTTSWHYPDPICTRWTKLVLVIHVNSCPLLMSMDPRVKRTSREWIMVPLLTHSYTICKCGEGWWCPMGIRKITQWKVGCEGDVKTRRKIVKFCKQYHKIKQEQSITVKETLIHCSETCVL